MAFARIEQTTIKLLSICVALIAYIERRNLFAANYSADEDEYLTKRNGKGFNDFNLDINERPICEQPGRQDTAVLR